MQTFVQYQTFASWAAVVAAVSPLSVDARERDRIHPSHDAFVQQAAKEITLTVIGTDTHQTLTGVASGDVSLLEEVLGLREAQLEANGLDSRTFALVKITALIALDAPPASYAWQVGNALNDGASAEDILAVLVAVAPQVGGPRVVAAAPEIMLALGLSLPDGEV
jgi:alkylhydroperoxidase/carboxymuconolactone decarboxylase family protein YurZ